MKRPNRDLEDEKKNQTKQKNKLERFIVVWLAKCESQIETNKQNNIKVNSNFFSNATFYINIVFELSEKFA